MSVWNGRISPVFDVSRQLLLLAIQDRTVIRRSLEPMPAGDSMNSAARLAELRVDTLICGAISRPLAGRLAAYGVNVIPFTAGEVEAVIAACLAGSLPNPDMTMPGCCRTSGTATGRHVRRRCSYAETRRNGSRRGRTDDRSESR